MCWDGVNYNDQNHDHNNLIKLIKMDMSQIREITELPEKPKAVSKSEPAPILFRAFDKNNEQWCNWFSMGHDGQTITDIRMGMGHIWDGQYTPSWVLSQWTGLKDKYQLKIFEGDVLVDTNLAKEDREKLIVVFGVQTYEGFYTAPGYGLFKKSGDRYDPMSWEGMEVVGDVFSHPDIMK